jgi:type II secretory ATPase GspE/PulE/Tfp pilus assembly ATPase PilB-like protein
MAEMPLHRLDAEGSEAPEALVPLSAYEPLPEQYAQPFLREHQAIKLRETDAELLVGSRHAVPGLLRNLQRAHGKQVARVPLSRSEIGSVLLRRRGAERTIDRASVPKVADGILLDGIESRASDIQVDRTGARSQVRFRRDGVMHRVCSLCEEAAAALIARLKAVAHMNTLDTLRPQDGRVSLRSGDHAFELRLSSIPTRQGESLMVRLLPGRTQHTELGRLGFPMGVVERLQGCTEAPAGLFLVCGPADSGKTTTLHAMIRRSAAAGKKAVTVEDPVEYPLADALQVQARAELGFDIAATLRSILRHTPDVIMVGEIRDEETTSLALRAALTGHLVLATLHADSSRTALARLLNLGACALDLATVLIGVLAQRLARTPCPACGGAPAPVPRGEEPTYEVARRCARCWGTGYDGRTPIVEHYRPGAADRERIARGDLPLGAPQPSLLDHARRLVGLRRLDVSEAARVLDMEAS